MGLKATQVNYLPLTRRSDNNGLVTTKDDRLNDQIAEQIEQELRQEFRQNVANLNLTNEQKMQLQQEIDSAIMKFKGENRGKFNLASEYREALGKLIGDTTQKFLDSIQKENKNTDDGTNTPNTGIDIGDIGSLDIQGEYNKIYLDVIMKK